MTTLGKCSYKQFFKELVCIHFNQLNIIKDPLPYALFLFIEVLALLLTDLLVFLQEKDQKYIFAAVVRLYCVTTQTCTAKHLQGYIMFMYFRIIEFSFFRTRNVQ